MSHIILIRELRVNDEITVRELIRNSYSSLVTESFISVLLKEITFQLIVLTAAIMFIFIGYPINYCILSIPIVIIIIYISIYTSHIIKSIEVFQTKHLQSWVAEACEPFFFSQDPQTVSYKILTEQDLKDESLDLGSQQRRVIGTIAVMKHRVADNGCWAYRLAVDGRYQRKGIGTALAKAAVKWCKVRSYDSIECAVTENQTEARQLFMKAGFQLRQMYHKKLLGSALTLVKFQMGLDLNPLL